jgi:hypothetical protein
MKCKMENSKCKQSLKPPSERHSPFAFCILHFELLAAS